MNFDNILFYFNPDERLFKKLKLKTSEVKNPKFSPNCNYLAYTKDNNLYYYNLELDEEIQLTFDTSKTVYNGWASWVYYEEILGRKSKYKAFWWSPNSKKIAFLRFDDSPVPVFSLFNPDSLHGFWEKHYYPKAGDPNPLVKLGIVDISSKKITWVNKITLTKTMLHFQYGLTIAKREISPVATPNKSKNKKSR